MKTLTLIAALVVATSVPARELTLEQALELASRHSFSLQKARALTDAASADHRAARAERFPTLSAIGNGTYISDVSTLNIPLPTGQSLEREVGTHENYQADLRLNLPLFTGGRISGGIALARASQELHAALESADQDKIAYLTRLEYFGLYRTTELRKVAEASLHRADVISRNVHSLYEAGAADSVALLDAQLALIRAQLAVEQATTNRRISELRMLTMLGLPYAESLSIDAVISSPTQVSPDALVAPDKPELLAAEASTQVAAAKYRVSKAEYFPTIAAFGGYSYGKPNLDRFGNSWNDYFTAGATLTWSFNVGGRTANRSRAAAHSLEASRSERDQVLETLTREANLAAEQLKLAYTRYQTSLREFQISEDHFRLAQGQHSDGVLSSNRLLEIEADLTASEASLAASLMDYYIAQSGYFYTTGSENLKKGI
ncbi:MAG: TolC family protein [candidate division Zixibacteria bacterium]|nr:TolC family protein [candidate division Zixibacteria bacterium]